MITSTRLQRETLVGDATTHEVSAPRCAFMTKSLRWIGTEIKDISSFDGLADVNEFLQQFEQEIP